MLRATTAALIMGLAWISPALATSDRNDMLEALTVRASTVAEPAGSAATSYVRAECDVRLPSCRRWWSLATERLERHQNN
jgi:hypothetical protein